MNAGPFFDNGVASLYHADARHIPLPDESVHCAITSPPYWFLRDYGLEPCVWGDDPECAHEWVDGIASPGSRAVDSKAAATLDGYQSRRVAPNEGQRGTLHSKRLSPG